MKIASLLILGTALVQFTNAWTLSLYREANQKNKIDFYVFSNLSPGECYYYTFPTPAVSADWAYLEGSTICFTSNSGYECWQSDIPQSAMPDNFYIDLSSKATGFHYCKN